MICGHPRKIVKVDQSQSNLQQSQNQQLSPQQGQSTANQNMLSQKVGK